MCQFGIKTAGVYMLFCSPSFFVSFFLSFSDLVQETGILHQFYFVISFPYFYCFIVVHYMFAAAMLLLLLLFAMNWQYIRKQRQKQFLKFRVLVRFSDSFGHFRQRLCIRIYSKNVRNIFGIPGTLKTKTSLIGSQKLKSQ